MITLILIVVAIGLFAGGWCLGGWILLRRDDRRRER